VWLPVDLLSAAAAAPLNIQVSFSGIMNHPTDLSNQLTNFTSIPYLSIQPDWYNVISDARNHTNTAIPSLKEVNLPSHIHIIPTPLPPLKFWLSSSVYNEDEEKSKHIEGEVSVSLENNEIKLQPSAEFSVTLTMNNHLLVECKETGAAAEILPQIKTLGNLVKQNTEIFTADISSDGNQAAIGSVDGSIKLFNLNSSSAEITEFKGHVGDINLVKFFPSNQVLLSTGADLQIKIWSIPSSKCILTLSAHSRSVNAIQLIQRGKYFMTGSKDGTIKLFDCAQSKPLESYCSVAEAEKSKGISTSEINDMIIYDELSSAINTNKTDNNSIPESIRNTIVVAAYEDGSIRGYLLNNPSSPLFSIRLGSQFHLTAVAKGPVDNSILVASEVGHIIAIDLKSSNVLFAVRRDDARIHRILSHYNPNNLNLFLVANSVGAVSEFQFTSTNTQSIQIVRELSGAEAEIVFDATMNAATNQLLTVSAGAARLYGPINQ
jgi:WD40 repeat protein